MKCPHLSEASKKVCVKMLEKNLNGEVSDFDIKHFCDGNPVYCYYFRLPIIQAVLKAKKQKENIIETESEILSAAPEIPREESIPKGVRVKPETQTQLKEETCV